MQAESIAAVPPQMTRSLISASAQVDYRASTKPTKKKLTFGDDYEIICD